MLFHIFLNWFTKAISFRTLKLSIFSAPLTDLGKLLDIVILWFNRHFTVMKVRSDPMCSACEEEEETTQHYLVSCWAYAV